ncbi:MAG: SDR family NAD(P)-dependent oxidoreductase [Bacteroidales bacterium]|nr:SDR family NAD(P)-dependent oxidoreductase [Bacteroidales bacterium]
MSGKVIITGATGGIGSAVTRALAARGCDLVLACRNAAKAEKLRQQVLADNPAARLEVRSLDLASLASVRTFAERFAGIPVSALFNNAGVISRGYSLTGDGLENTFGINYFAPFLLTELLLPALEADARIVNMVSLTCRFVRVDESSLQPAEKDFSQLGTYARSKLALLHASQELARRHPRLRVNLADPGIVNSGIITMGRWFDPLADLLFRPLIKSPERGAVPPLAALAAEEGMRYFAGTRVREIPARFRDPVLQRRLWEETERLLAIR